MNIYRLFRKMQRWDRRAHRAEQLAKKHRQWKERQNKDELAQLEQEMGSSTEKRFFD